MHVFVDAFIFASEVSVVSNDETIEQYSDCSMSASTSKDVQLTVVKHVGPQGNDISVVFTLSDDMCVFQRLLT